MPPGGGLADFSHLQFIRGLVDQREERTHGDDPGQVEAAHLDAHSHLHSNIKLYLLFQRKTVKVNIIYLMY